MQSSSCSTMSLYVLYPSCIAQYCNCCWNGECVSGYFSVFPCFTIAACESLNVLFFLKVFTLSNCSLLNYQLNPNSLLTKAEIIRPCPSPFGIRGTSPLGLFQHLLLNVYCLNMHSSCPKMSSGLSDFFSNRKMSTKG